MTLAYVTIGVNDVAAVRPFYDAIMPHIGGKLYLDYAPNAVSYDLPGGGKVWVCKPFNGETASPGNGQMTGFLCASQDDVRKAYEAALANGGTSEGEPGPRPHYGPHFFGGYVRDPEGNKMSFVHFGG